MRRERRQDRHLNNVAICPCCYISTNGEGRQKSVCESYSYDNRAIIYRHLSTIHVRHVVGFRRGCAHSPLGMARAFPLCIVRFFFLHEGVPSVDLGGYRGKVSSSRLTMKATFITAVFAHARKSLLNSYVQALVSTGASWRFSGAWNVIL